MSSLNQIISRQINKWVLEKEIYSHIKDERGIAVKPAVMKPVITVSRQRGALGYELAKSLATSMDYGFFDKALTDYIAKDSGVRSDCVDLLDEHDLSELKLWVTNMLTDHVFDYDDYIHELSKILMFISMQGGVVILGRGANFILRNTNAFHVRVVAPLETRIQNIMRLEGKTEVDARRSIQQADKERGHLVQRYFKKNIEDPTEYDLVINMNAITVESAVKIIMTALRACGWSWEVTGGDKRLVRNS